MGNGAMLGKLRSPRALVGGRNNSSTPVVGRACEDARSRANSNEDVDAGVARLQCTRCSATRALPYGTVAFTCSACSSDVRVSLSNMSMRSKADARLHMQKAERIVSNALEEQSASCKQLWEGLKKCFADEEDAVWNNRRRSTDAGRARELVRTALSAHDLAHAAETIEHWADLGLPLASGKISSALSMLRHEDEVELLWRRAARALEAVDRVELELWCQEAASKDLCVPREIKAAIQALHGQERASRAEEEYQAKLKARVSEARIRDDTDTLKALAMEARLLGEDPSVVDAVLAPAKSYRRKRTGEHDTPKTTPRECVDSSDAKKCLKEELYKRGISAMGMEEKDELINLLERAKSIPMTDPIDKVRTDCQHGAAQFRRGPPISPSGGQGFYTSSAKPPVGPRPRTSSKQNIGQVPPGMPFVGEDTTCQQARRPPFTSAWSSAWGASSVGGAMSSSSKPSSKSSTFDDDVSGGNDAELPQRSCRPSSAYSYVKAPSCTESSETMTPQRPSRPSSASARFTPGRGSSSGCDLPDFIGRQSSASSTFVEGCSEKGSCGEATTPQRRPSSARGVPGCHETSHSQRANRPSSASLHGRPPAYTESQFGEREASPRPARVSSGLSKPPTYVEGSSGETAAQHRRPSSASLRASAAVPSVRESRSGRPSSASGHSQSCSDGTSGAAATPQRPTRPSSVPRAAQDAASPRRSPSPPRNHGFSTPSDADRRHKRTYSMPPRPPSQSPRPASSPPPRAAGSQSSGPQSARMSTTTRAAALTCLGLKGDPTGDEIRRAYKQAALKCHPDRPQNHANAEEAKDKFQEVKAAFDLLQGPERRLAAAAGG